MAYQKINQFIDTDEQIGAFSGYIKRSQPTIAGMVAQFFGENGEDADTILALSLTKFLDAQVYVSIRIIKDSLGNVMKKNGEFPEIANFIGVVRRAVPSRNGMTAQFFAPNGEDADAVNDLNKSFYQDCLVYIDVRGKLAKYKTRPIEHQISVHQTIDNSYLNKATEYQKKEYSKKEKTFKKLNDTLKLSGFLRNTDVLFNLGNESEYEDWLMTKGCSFPFVDSVCHNEPIQLLSVKGIMSHFNPIPFCEEHILEVEKDYNILPSGVKFLEMKQQLLIQDWAWHLMKQKFSLTGNEEPDVEKVISWSSEKGLQRLLPNTYKIIK